MRWNICLVFVVLCPVSIFSVVKDGVCLTAGGFGICVEKCQNDEDCGDIKKCCSNGCGHICMNPHGVESPTPVLTSDQSRVAG